MSGAKFDKTARLATWNDYHNMAEVLCVEDGSDWKELTIGDIIEIVAQVIKESA